MWRNSVTAELRRLLVWVPPHVWEMASCQRESEKESESETKHSSRFFMADWSCYGVGPWISLSLHLQSLTPPLTPRLPPILPAAHWHAWFISFLQFWAVADSQFGYFPAEAAQRRLRVIWFYGHIPKPVTSANRIRVGFWIGTGL